MSDHAADLEEPYDPNAAPERIAMVGGAWYLAREYGEALGPFASVEEDSEIVLYHRAIGGRMVKLEVTRDGVKQLHVHPDACVDLTHEIISSLFDTCVRFGYRSLEHNAAKKASNNFQIGRLHILAELAKENAVCVTRIHETWDKERTARAESFGGIAALNASREEAARVALSATTAGTSPRSGASASRAKLQKSPMVSTALPESWKRPAPGNNQGATIPSPACDTIPGKPASERSASESPSRGAGAEPSQVKQVSLFQAHEIAPTIKPGQVKAKRAQKKAARAGGASK